MEYKVGDWVEVVNIHDLSARAILKVGQIYKVVEIFEDYTFIIYKGKVSGGYYSNRFKKTFRAQIQGTLNEIQERR